MDVNPQGSHIHYRDLQTPRMNDPNSISMEGKAHDLNWLQGRCAIPINNIHFNLFRTPSFIPRPASATITSWTHPAKNMLSQLLRYQDLNNAEYDIVDA